MVSVSRGYGSERGGYDVIEINGVAHKVRHSAALALTVLQEELEVEFNLPLLPGGRP